MTKLDVFERELRVASIGRIIGEEHKRNFISIAESGKNAELVRQHARGAVPSVETTVDGVLGAPLNAVKLGGRIRFDFRYWIEVAKFAIQTLRDFSPVESGAYRDAHFILAGGVQIDSSAIPPRTVEIVITNDVPYSRKIQIGAMEMSVPPGVYDRARIAVAAKFGNLFKIDVIFVDLSGAYLLRKTSGRLRYPALSIRARFAI